MKKILMLGMFFFISIKAHAGVIEVTQNGFNADYSESFESLFGLYHPYQSEKIFDNKATITGDNEWIDDHFLSMASGGWDVETINNGVVRQLANDGLKYVAIGGLGFVNIAFDVDVFSFGGFFSNGHVNQPSIFDFYDHHNMLIDSFLIDLPSQFGEMNWAGFDSDVSIGSVRISGIDTTIDNLMISTATQVSEPKTIYLFFTLAALLLVRKISF
ncbi:hypothetical protein KO495_07315 [Colwellia sp. D2M02]|uniref:hypothetical protein n=1 Tax=Colwellia sp. D2M02 TaxID=2841562 RepID=UPI001C08EC5B|nr:hypothetical protein [Colwellia sp. D2M02]MBU2893135.1 hypothetical protein [Colwellia sp. D2M02]